MDFEKKGGKKQGKRRLEWKVEWGLSLAWIFTASSLLMLWFQWICGIHTGSVTAADCSSTQAAGLKTDDLVCVVIHERTMEW